MEPHVYANHVIDVLADAYTLGDGAKSIVRRAVATCRAQAKSPPTARDVLKAVEAIRDKERVRGWKISAIRALESLVTAQAGGHAAEGQHAFTRALTRQTTILELDALDQGNKRFLIPLLCLWLYQSRLAASEREQLKLVLIVEEAHHVLQRHQPRANETVMEMLLRQGREVGLGTIVVDQSPSLLSPVALNNCYTSICLNLKDSSDVNRAASISLVENGDKRYFSLLPVGHAIVKLQDRWRRPFRIRIPHLDVPKGLVTDTMVGDLMSGTLPHADLRRLVRQKRHTSKGAGQRVFAQGSVINNLSCTAHAAGQFV